MAKKVCFLEFDFVDKLTVTFSFSSSNSQSAKKAAKQKRQAQNQARSRANKNASTNDDDSKQIKQMTAKMETISLGQDGQGKQTLSLVPSGLGNQGNTCYFNSAMQILGQTYVLNRCLAERSDPEYRWKASTVYLDVGNSAKKEEDGCEDNCGNLDARFKVDSRVMQLPDPHPLITAFVTLQRQIFTGR